MKILKEDYNNLKADFENEVKRLSVEYKTIDSMLVAILAVNDRIKDANVALRWYIYHSIPNQYTKYTKVFYSYGCNDSHIDTALKNILKEVKATELIDVL